MEFSLFNFKLGNKKKRPATLAESGSARLALSQQLADVKSVFPNGDPTFFIPSHTLKARFDDEVIRNPYSSNTWVYAACVAITTPLIQLEKVLDDKQDNEETPVITEDPILDLLENPNPLMDGPTFWENVILNLMLPTQNTKGGQCFIIAESGTDKPVNLKKGDIPKELYPFSDQFFEPVLQKKDNMLVGWKFKPANTDKTIFYSVDEVIRVHLVDPNNPLKGQAPIWATRQGLRQGSKADSLNESFFDNNASLGGMLMTDAELGDKEADDLRKQFTEKYSGPDKAGRVPLLHTGLRYEMFQQTHVDMQFLEQKKWIRDEILAAYRVPKFAVSLYEDLNLATAKEAVRIFWNQTLLPLDSRIMRAFNNQWICHTNNGRWKLESDLTKVPALQPNLDAKLDQATKLHNLTVPLKEINRRLELQLELDEVPWAETHLMNLGKVPAENLLGEPLPPEEGEENPGGAPAEGTEEEEDEEGKTNAPSEADLKINAVMDALSTTDKATEQEIRSRDKYLKTIILPDEKKFASILRKYFITQRNKIQDRVDDWAKGQSKSKAEFEKPNARQLTGFKKEEDRRLQKATKPEYERQAKREGAVISAQLEGLDEWKFASPTMKRVIRERLRQITSINTTTFKFARNAISRVVEDAVEEGLGLKETAKRIKQEVNKVYAGRIRSDTIARTETSSIHSQTRMDIYKEEGITKIKWLTAGDELVRSSDDSDFPHDLLNDTVVERSEGFDNGESIMFPLDPDASPGNVINCRCTVIAVKE